LIESIFNLSTRVVYAAMIKTPAPTRVSTNAAEVNKAAPRSRSETTVNRLHKKHAVGAMVAVKMPFKINLEVICK